VRARHGSGGARGHLARGGRACGTRSAAGHGARGGAAGLSLSSPAPLPLRRVAGKRPRRGGRAMVAWPREARDVVEGGTRRRALRCWAEPLRAAARPARPRGRRRGRPALARAAGASPSPLASAAAETPAPSIGALELDFGRRRPSSLPPLHELELGRWVLLRLLSAFPLPAPFLGFPAAVPTTGQQQPRQAPRHVRGLESSAECARFGGNGGLRFGRVSDKGCHCSSFYYILELKDGLQVAGAGSLRTDRQLWQAT